MFEGRENEDLTDGAQLEAVIENKFEKPFCIHTSVGPNTSLKLKVQKLSKGREKPKDTDAGEAESKTNLQVTTQAWGPERGGRK